MTEKTYAKIAWEAEKQILEGEGAILDATFGQKAHREKIVRLAERHRVPLVLIHCVASDETTEKRLAQREAEGKGVSDGRWEIYSKQKAAFEPINELPPANCLKLNTELPREQLARVVKSFCGRKSGKRGSSVGAPVRAAEGQRRAQPVLNPFAIILAVEAELCCRVDL